MNIMEWLTGVTAFAATINAIALIYDVYFRYEYTYVNLIVVPNENKDGTLQFKCKPDGDGSKNADKIKVNADKSVEIFNGDSKRRYSSYVYWIK